MIESVVDTYIHCLFLVTILSTFFWLVVTRFSKQALQKELRHAIHGLIDGIDWGFLPQSIRQQIHSFDEELLYGQEAEITTVNNNWLFSTTILFLTTVWGGLVFVLWLLSLSKTLPDMWDIVAENIILFMCVGVVELCFFLFVALKYVPTKPSLLVSTVVDSAKQQLKNSM